MKKICKNDGRHRLHETKLSQQRELLLVFRNRLVDLGGRINNNCTWKIREQFAVNESKGIMEKQMFIRIGIAIQWFYRRQMTTNILINR